MPCLSFLAFVFVFAENYGSSNQSIVKESKTHTSNPQSMSHEGAWFIRLKNSVLSHPSDGHAAVPEPSQQPNPMITSNKNNNNNNRDHVPCDDDDHCQQRQKRHTQSIDNRSTNNTRSSKPPSPSSPSSCAITVTRSQNRSSSIQLLHSHLSQMLQSSSSPGGREESNGRNGAAADDDNCRHGEHEPHSIFRFLWHKLKRQFISVATTSDVDHHGWQQQQQQRKQRTNSKKQKQQQQQKQNMSTTKQQSFHLWTTAAVQWCFHRFQQLNSLLNVLESLIHVFDSVGMFSIASLLIELRRFLFVFFQLVRHTFFLFDESSDRRLLLERPMMHRSSRLGQQHGSGVPPVSHPYGYAATNYGMQSSYTWNRNAGLRYD